MRAIIVAVLLATAVCLATSQPPAAQKKAGVESKSELSQRLGSQGAQ
jgi:hypothetical protein